MKGEIEVLLAEIEYYEEYHMREKQACDMAVELLLKVVANLPMHQRAEVNEWIKKIHSIRHGG